MEFQLITKSVVNAFVFESFAEVGVSRRVEIKSVSASTSIGVLLLDGKRSDRLEDEVRDTSRVINWSIDDNSE
jgi:hypothetical protein